MTLTSTEVLERFRTYLEEEQGYVRPHLLATIRALLNQNSDSTLLVATENQLLTVSDGYSRRYVPFLNFLKSSGLENGYWRNDFKPQFATDYPVIQHYLAASGVKSRGLVSTAIHHFLKANEQQDIDFFIGSNPWSNLVYVTRFLEWVSKFKPVLEVPIDVADAIKRIQARRQEKFITRGRKNKLPDFEHGPDQLYQNVLESAQTMEEKLMVELIVGKGLGLTSVLKMTGKELAGYVEKEVYAEALRSYLARGRSPAFPYTKVELERLINRCLRKGTGNDGMTLSQWRKFADSKSMRLQTE